ncbi:MAG TPA: dual specificity protein phosphatase family protein [Planctomycetota bacterium]|nr:dual specificity protein phosphatase family protein [Planctomycetota bacterium]
MHNFSWLIPGRLAGMAAPGPSDGERMRRAGVTGVVSLTRTPPFGGGPGEPEVLHLPVRDMAAPTRAQLRRAARFLDRVIADGGRAVVHCTAGYGRTGTVLAAYLVWKGADPDEAIHRVREARPGSIETAGQEHAVHRFAESLRAAASSTPRRSRR